MNIWVVEVEGEALVFDPAIQLPGCPHLFLWNPIEKEMEKYIAHLTLERIKPHSNSAAARAHIESYEHWYKATGSVWLENEKPYYSERKRIDEEKNQARLAEEVRKVEARQRETERKALIHNFLSKHTPRCFYHFTDTRNIPSIRDSGGLWSMHELRERGIIVSAPGGSSNSQLSDQRNGMDRYVHLCLFKSHPMEYCARQDGRIEHSRFLEIDCDTLLIEGVRFTPAMSNQIGVTPLEFEQAVLQMDFEAVYGGTDWSFTEQSQRLRVAKKYELLIPDHVPIRYIRGL